MNAQQLKDSILQYAMQGKLVLQDKNDEPAFELVKRISQQKERLVQEKVIKQEKSLAPISKEEIPFDIPDNWEWVRVRDVVQLINGRAYKRNELLSDNNLTPVLRVGNLFTNKSWYYSDLNLPEDKYCNNGDLLYAWSASFGPHIWEGEKSIFHYHIWKIRLFEENLKKYIYYHLLRDAREIKRSTTGSTMVHITKERMERMLIPIPPIEEQKRIVAKIEELFGKIEEFEEKYQNLDELINKFPTRLENSTLHYAMQGKLVAQDPSEEPAAELIKKIREEKARLIKEKIIKKEKPLPPITEEEIPYDIPENWEWVRIGEIFKLQAGKNITSSQISENPTEEYKYLCYGGNGKRGYVKTFNKQGKYALIGRQGALCGNINFAEGQFYASEHAVVVDHFNLLDVQWSGYFLEALKLNQYATATAQPGLAVSNIVNKLIPLPPFEEQKRIVEKIEELSTLIKNLKSKVK